MDKIRKRLSKYLNLLTTKKIIFLIIFIGFLTYGKSLFNGFIADDEAQIINNILVHSIKNIPRFFSGGTFYTGGNTPSSIYYKPITVTFFSLIYNIFGHKAFYFHLFQLALHIINTVIIYFIFRDFFKKNLSLFLSIVFLLHPLNVEAVSYISASQEPLFFFFGAGSLLLAMRKVINYKQTLIISFLLIISMLSKETGMLFLFLVITYLLYLKRTKKSYILILFLNIFTIYFILRFAVANIYFNEQIVSPIMKSSLIERLINLPKIINYYVINSLIPNNLVFAQSWIIKSINFRNFYLPLIIDIIFFSIIFFFGLIIWRHKRNNIKIYIFFFVWFFLGLILHSQIFPLDLTVADRWFYFPMVGLLGILGLLIQNLKISNKNTKLIYFVLAIITIFLLMKSTISRSLNWKNELTLYKHDMSISLPSFQLENIYGAALGRAGQYEEAHKHFIKSVNLFPSFSAWTNLGVNYERRGRIDDSIASYKKAIDSYNYYLAYENLAILLYFYKEPQSLKDFAEKSLVRFPNNSKLMILFALSEYKLGNKERAITLSKKAYTIDPNPFNTYVYTNIEQNLPLNINPR